MNEPDRNGLNGFTAESISEKELEDMLSGVDDDLINRQIDALLAERGEQINMDNIRYKARRKLEKDGKRKRGVWKMAGVAAAVAVLTVSSVYGDEILQSFRGKSKVYQTIVDGEAYYLPEELALGGQYVLSYAGMFEGRLELEITADADMTDQWYESLDLSVSEADGTSYKAGGYGTRRDDSGGKLQVSFYNMPAINAFELSLDGEKYPVTLTRAEELNAEENLVVGVPEAEIPEGPAEETGETPNEAGEIPKEAGTGVQAAPVANIAAIRTDTEQGVNINVVVGFEDTDLKLRALGEEKEAIRFRRTFENDGERSSSTSGGGSEIKPLMAYDANGKAYELKEPADAIGSPVTMFETDAPRGEALTLEVPAVIAGYEKEVDRIILDIPAEGEAEINQEIDFIIQKAIISKITRTSPTTADIIFQLNTGANESVALQDIGVSSGNVSKGEMTLTGGTASLTLTFSEDTEQAELTFTWPRFLIEGGWTIELGNRG